MTWKFRKSFVENLEIRCWLFYVDCSLSTNVDYVLVEYHEISSVDLCRRSCGFLQFWVDFFSGWINILFVTSLTWAQCQNYVCSSPEFLSCIDCPFHSSWLNYTITSKLCVNFDAVKDSIMSDLLLLSWADSC